MAKQFRKMVGITIGVALIIPWSLIFGLHYLRPWLPSLDAIKTIGLVLLVWLGISVVVTLVFITPLWRSRQKDEKARERWWRSQFPPEPRS